MFLLVSGGHICAPERDTNMASPYKALQIWVKRFSEYLAYELLHRPDSWQDFLHIYLLSLSVLKGFRFHFCFLTWVKTENRNRERWTGLYPSCLAAKIPLDQIKECPPGTSARDECYILIIRVACSAGVFFERAICSRKRHDRIWTIARLFVYLSSFISQILDFLY